MRPERQLLKRGPFRIPFWNSALLDVMDPFNLLTRVTRSHYPLIKFIVPLSRHYGGEGNSSGQRLSPIKEEVC
jgi:hypothetical protein